MFTLIIILLQQQPPSHPCLLCCLTLSLVYSILNSWISMELCIFPYQHRGGPRPTLPQKGLTVYSVGHSLPSKRGLSFHRSFHHHHRSGYNHLWVGLMWGSVWGLGRISVTSQPLLPTSAPGHTALLLITNMYSLQPILWFFSFIHWFPRRCCCWIEFRWILAIQEDKTGQKMTKTEQSDPLKHKSMS